VTQESRGASHSVAFASISATKAGLKTEAVVVMVNLVGVVPEKSSPAFSIHGYNAELGHRINKPTVRSNDPKKKIHSLATGDLRLQNNLFYAWAN
jgi:hypothetical protein